MIFQFFDFLVYFILLLLILNLLILPSLLFYLKTSLLSLFLPKVTLSNNLVIFSIKISEATILLKF